jgi:glyoxylate/hydroxypyruvate reductase A
VIFSLGAGVDHIFAADHVPDVPIVRFVDHSLTTRMSEWICLQCLSHLRQSRKYDALQRSRNWRELPQPQADEITIGIMGMGVLGQDAARKLKTLGFNVIGWSRTSKAIDGIRCFDADEFNLFLEQSQFLVGLLPLTKETTGIFNRNVFQRLARNEEIATPVFINAGRGGSQIEADIVSCLEDGTLGGVSLDVFEREPLDDESPLWGFDNAILTPHAAAVSDVDALARHVARQIGRYESGQALENVVDRKLGY